MEDDNQTLKWDFEDFSEQTTFDDLLSHLRDKTEFPQELESFSLHDDEDSRFFNFLTSNPDPRQQINVNSYVLTNTVDQPSSSSVEENNVGPQDISLVSFEELEREYSSPSSDKLSDDLPASSGETSSYTSPSSSFSVGRKKRRERDSTISPVVIERRANIVKRSNEVSFSVINLTGVLGKINKSQLFSGNVTLHADDKIPFLSAISYLFDDPSNYFPVFEGFSDIDAMFGDHGISLSAKHGVEEQFVQFPEFEDREFSLLGKTDKEKLQGFIPSPRRGVRINSSTLIDLLHQTPEQILPIDARFDYEYEGATIGGYGSDNNGITAAINIDEYWNFKKIFNTLWVETDGIITARYPGKKLIVFCEFSSMRGPGLYRNITLLDHLIAFSKNTHPSNTVDISYPEIYILQGGFRGFFEHTKTNLLQLNQERKMFIAVSTQDFESSSPLPSGFDLYVSEFFQSSEPNWKRKKEYMEKKTYINDLKKILNFTEQRFTIFKSFIQLCDPLLISHDSFDIFKQHLASVNPKYSQTRHSIVSLEEIQNEPFAQRQRLGDDI